MAEETEVQENEQAIEPETIEVGGTTFSMPYLEYARQLTDEEEQGLEESISEHGILDPIIINNSKLGKNRVLGGHNRLKIASRLRIKADKIPIRRLTIEDADEEATIAVGLTGAIGRAWDKTAIRYTIKFLKTNLKWANRQIARAMRIKHSHVQYHLEKLGLKPVSPSRQSPSEGEEERSPSGKPRKNAPRSVHIEAGLDWVGGLARCIDIIGLRKSLHKECIQPLKDALLEAKEEEDAKAAEKDGDSE